MQADEVFARLRDRAQSGDSSSQTNLGLCYQFGYGVTQDYKQAAVWFRRAAKAGLAMAQFNLGGLYYEGKGVKKNLKRALEWYTLAAEQREELALLKLGYMYQKGIGVEMNFSRAAVLYLIAYNRGSARAANHLAFLFKKGLGVESDDALAYELYLESVNNPDTPSVKPEPSYPGSAYYWLGYMAENGEGIPRDLHVARRWYRRGADLEISACVKALERLAASKRCRTR